MVIELEEVPPLVDPVMIAAFEGWNDAGEAASSAVDHLISEWSAQTVAAIDPEDFYDFQVNRPTVSLGPDGERQITWPTSQLAVCRPPGSERDLVLLRGIEPNMRWRGFCAELLAAADDLGGQIVVTLGALLADTPHTRPVPVSGTATEPELVDRLKLETSTYEGPTGIVGVLQTACAAAGMPAASLWAAVPHYVAVAPNPKGALAILRRLESLVGVTVDASDLESAAADYERQVTRAVELDPEVQAFVERLERAADAEEGPTDLSQIPSGDVLAREFQRFLRQRGGGSQGA
jgi:proteasome assembly chaperone (PAC2) family protein